MRAPLIQGSRHTDRLINTPCPLLTYIFKIRDIPPLTSVQQRLHIHTGREAASH